MASPQKENGYAPIANEILEAISKCKLNGTQFRILTTVWRYTYGFSRKHHELSVTFISGATDIAKRRIQKELNDLIEKNILKEVREASFNQTRIIEFNKNYDQWELDTSPNKKHQDTNISTGDEKDTSPDVKKDTSTGDQKDTSPGDEKDTQENNIKTNIKTSIKANSDVREIWDFWDQNGFGFGNTKAKEKLSTWLDEKQFEESKDMILFAMDIATDTNALNYGFLNYLLSDWLTKGAKNLNDCKALQTEFKNSRNKFKPKKTKSLFEQGEESKKRFEEQAKNEKPIELDEDFLNSLPF